MDKPQIDQRLSQTTPINEYMEEDVFCSIDDMPDDYKKFRSKIWILFHSILPPLVGILIVLNPRNKSWNDPKWGKWDFVIFVVLCGRLVSGLLFRIILLFMERSFVLRKRVLYFVYCLKEAVQKCIWLDLFLFAWRGIFNKKDERVSQMDKVLRYVTRIWICLLVGTIIWLLKTLIIKVLAHNFHVSNYFDRIQESLFSQYVINKLTGPPKQEQKLTPEKQENRIMIEHLQRMDQKNISAWNMTRMMNAVSTTITTMLTTLDEDLTQIISENQAKVAAKKMFRNVAKPDSNHIDLEDLMRFLGKNQALNTIRLFDGASRTNGISTQALKNWVVTVFRERRALISSLKGIKSVEDKVHLMLNVVLGIIIIIIWLLILEVLTTHILIFLTILLSSFVFGVTCNGTIGGLIFLFVVHPFDIGDRCKINDIQMTVKEINILTTVFLKDDNEEIRHYNSVLSTMSIANYRRSPDMDEVIDFCVDPSTSNEDVDKMKKMLTSYVESNTEHWHPGPEIIVTGVVDSNSNRLKRSLLVFHRMNFQDMDERWKRRTLLVKEMEKIFKELKIGYNMIQM